MAVVHQSCVGESIGCRESKSRIHNLVKSYSAMCLSKIVSEIATIPQ